MTTSIMAVLLLLPPAAARDLRLEYVKLPGLDQEGAGSTGAMVRWPRRWGSVEAWDCTDPLVSISVPGQGTSWVSVESMGAKGRAESVCRIESENRLTFLVVAFDPIGDGRR